MGKKNHRSPDKSPKHKRSRMRTPESPTSSPTRRNDEESIVDFDTDDGIDVSELEREFSESQQDSQTSVSVHRAPRLISWIWNHGTLTEDGKGWRCGVCEEEP